MHKYAGDCSSTFENAVLQPAVLGLGTVECFPGCSSLPPEIGVPRPRFLMKISAIRTGTGGCVFKCLVICEFMRPNSSDLWVFEFFFMIFSTMLL